MDQNERRLIEDLFARLRRVDSRAPARDGEAEALIRREVEALPTAPYYMAQTILVQEHALSAAQARLQELESRLAERAGGGFLAGLFGGGGPLAAGAAPPPAGRPTPAPGGFLAGAAQTALGVTGGMLAASAITSALAGGAMAAEPAPAEALDKDALFEETDLDAELDAGEEW
jgi:hypothetical protein